MSEEITINIKLQSQEEFPLTVTLQTKVSEVKEKCVEKAGIPVEDIRLIFKGRILKNEQTLEESKITSGITVHLVPSSESKGTAEAEAPKTDAPVGLGAPPTAAAAGGLGAIPGLVPGQVPDAAQIGEVLKNPKVQEMMSDPKFIQDMMEQNPFLKQMAESNPMMKSMLSNPELMKEMMNPDSIMSALSMMGGMGGGMPGMPPMPGMGGMGGFPGMPGMGMPGMGMPGMGMPGMPGMGMGMPPGFGMPGMGGFPGMGMPGMGMPGMGMPMGPMGMMGMNPMAGMMGMNPMMMGMMGGANPFAGAKPEHDMSKPPKERYAEEIGMLAMMGITDQDAICKALEESNGDLDQAMEKLAPLLDYGDEEGEGDQKK